ncbi:MAG TPA: pyridoxal phosphate-dependent aminotransferase [Fimbriimonas sp.]|nr:pyridoxal phosphate-dependent aminotransferase [Fimbriimonas sp.]
MPHIAHRAAQMPSSPIRRLVDYAVAAEKRGVHVHYLNIGQPDIASPEAFWEAVKNSHIQTLEYSHSAGIAPLREALSDHYKGRGIDVQPNEVMVTTGGSEATLFAFLSCFDPGDEVIVVEPFYANYLGFATVAGVKLVPITTRIEDDFSLPGPAEIASKLTAKTKGILLCNPSNPTGTAFPRATMEELARIAVEQDLFLIVDEVYRDFCYGSEALTSVLQLPGLERHAIMLDSASKKFSLCGARIGFLVTRNQEVLASALKFGQARLAAPTLDQIGVTACLRHTPASYFEAVRKEYVARRDLLRSELAAMPGVLCPTIDGAFYAVVRLPVDDSDRFCEWMVREFSYEGQTVLLAPASGFYVTPGEGKDEVRIAYVLGCERISQAMKCLSHALVAYQASRLAAV